MNWQDQSRQHMEKQDDGQQGTGNHATLKPFSKLPPLRITIDPTVEGRKPTAPSDGEVVTVEFEKPQASPSLGFFDSEASFHDVASIPPSGYTRRQPPQPSQTAPRRVLLLDDDVELCEVLVAILNWSGYEVVVAHRGVEALRAVMKEDFDAVVCDVVMPGMRGDMFYIALERVKPELCKVFIFITGYRDDGEINLFLRHTNCPFLYKPLDTNELLGKIKAVIAAAAAAE